MSQLLAGCFIILQFDPIYVVFIFGISVCAMLTTKCKVSQDQTGIRARWGGSTTGRRQRLSKESSQTVRPRFAVRAPFVAVPPAAFTSGVTVAAYAPMSFSKKLVVTCVLAVAKEI